MSQPAYQYLDLCPMAALTISRQGAIIYCNEATAKTMGSPGIEFTKTINVLSFPPMVQAGLADIIRQAIGSKETIQVERPYRSVWGKDLVLQAYCIPLQEPVGHPDEVLLIYIADVTQDRAHLQELAQASKAKTQFLANMSHEVRTPLNGVLGFLSLLDRQVQDGESREYIDAARSSAKSLLRLINEVLDIAKIEAGTLVVERKAIQVPLIIDSVIQQVKPLIQETDLEIRLEVPDHIKSVQGDSLRYSQVLFNLLSNAIKFTNRGSITIRCYEQYSEGGEYLLTEVIDTGIGIPLDSQHLVFLPFTQVDGTFTRKRDGAGLGLSICKSLVHLMGGEIGLESAVGKGSRFWFTLPITLRDSESESLPETLLRPDASSKPRSVLVVSSEPNDDHHVAKVLSDAGFHVQQFTHELAFPENSSSFDLMLFDLDHPTEQCYATVKSVRNQGWNGPIVAMLRLDLEGSAEIHQLCRDNGISDFLSKPCPSAVLIERVRHWLFRVSH